MDIRDKREGDGHVVTFPSLVSRKRRGNFFFRPVWKRDATAEWEKLFVIRRLRLGILCHERKGGGYCRSSGACFDEFASIHGILFLGEGTKATKGTKATMVLH